ncbi:MAG: 2-hydroxyacyl-CoA dehydratase [Clostridia bacterium]|nr:2-hydroxyacyl-CoA dehydratase [Clostridia bacterium]
MSKELYYIPFTEDMKKDYTILVPNMLPRHFKLILQVFRNHGYKLDLLETDGPQIAEMGLKYVHNDTCYPAILVIGQFLDAIQSGKYDPHKVALVLFQTGGGCRASNYLSLLRKALGRAGYDYVPVISLSLAGIEKHPGFKLTVPLLHRLFYALIYGDLILSLTDQCKPYELEKGSAEALADEFTEQLAAKMEEEGVSYKKVLRNCEEIVRRFAALPMNRVPKVKVGVVGEIYVKYSPLGNNNLAQFLVDEGAEVVMPGLLDFMYYCIYDNVLDYELYGMGRLTHPIYRIASDFIIAKQKGIIDIIEKDGTFRPPAPMTHTVERVRSVIGLGTKMGEGWLLPAEMLELYDAGVKNIVCTQPFGCLPNHICGKGMMKPLKDRHPDMNIVAIDYDAGATRVNQENRIKLMLANAKEQLDQNPET